MTVRLEKGGGGATIAPAPTSAPISTSPSPTAVSASPAAVTDASLRADLIRVVAATAGVALAVWLAVMSAG